MYIGILVVAFMIPFVMTEPNTAIENSDCGTIDVVPSTGTYKALLPLATVKLARELFDVWMNRHSELLLKNDGQDEEWYAILIRMEGDLTGRVTEDDQSCSVMSIYYRGGCRETNTTKTSTDCLNCIIKVSDFIQKKCFYSKIANGYSYDCFVRLSHEPFVPLPTPEWPTHHFPYVPNRI